MKKNRIWKMTAAAVLVILVLPFLVFGIRAAVIEIRINDGVADLINDAAISAPVRLANTPTIAQDITCGFATIQWVTRFLGSEVTEQELYDLNQGSIPTAYPKNFAPELEKHLGGKYQVTMLQEATNQEILRAMHESLANGLPVPISLAAEDATNRPNFTLHYSVATGMDLKNDHVYVSNVFGYEEVYSVREFLDALKFNNYRDEPFIIRMGLLFGLFHKNTIYILSPRE